MQKNSSICSAVFAEHRLMTDTDRHRAIASTRASIAYLYRPEMHASSVQVVVKRQTVAFDYMY